MVCDVYDILFIPLFSYKQEHSEFVQIMNGLKPRNPDVKLDRATYLSPSIPVSLPDQVDWSQKGYVTPVKNQVIISFCCTVSLM